MFLHKTVKTQIFPATVCCYPNIPNHKGHRPWYNGIMDILRRINYNTLNWCITHYTHLTLGFGYNVCDIPHEWGWYNNYMQHSIKLIIIIMNLSLKRALISVLFPVLPSPTTATIIILFLICWRRSSTSWLLTTKPWPWFTEHSSIVFRALLRKIWISS